MKYRLVSGCLLTNFARTTKNFQNLHKFAINRKYHTVKEPILLYGEDVANAKEKGLPVVALESTIITHGMPYPDNLDTALEVEHIIRQKGVVPATIAILNGQIKVGADKSEIEKLAKSEGKNVRKVSRRDFSYVVSQCLSGGTTVSGTMLIANQAGIPIMATGGIGGVHRQVDLSMDISADLKELGRTPVAVVCSGVKAILDIPKTLEYLESEGVPVATLGSTAKFPAFYSRQTHDALESPLKVATPEEASRLIQAQRRLGLETGILLAVPIPEPFALDPQEIEVAIKQALQAAHVKNVRGKSITPFLLSELSRLTGGRSLHSNKALIKNNAGVAAEIALHLASFQTNDPVSSGSCPGTSAIKMNPVVIGGATFDTVVRVKEPDIKFNGSTHRGESRRSCGGVGRNLAAALVNLGAGETKLLSVVGDDEAGRAVVSSLGTAASTVRVLPDTCTARYTAVVDNEGNCCFGIGEMDAFVKISREFLQQNLNVLKGACLVVMDGNPPLDAMKLVLDTSLEYRIPVWYEPTDIHKALKIFECGSAWKQVLKFVSPNVNELMAMANYFQIPVPPKESDIGFETIKAITEQLVERIPVIIATLGSKGVMVTRKSSQNDLFFDEYRNLVETSGVQSRLYAPLLFDKKISSVSGCGDCLAAGIITGIVRGWKEPYCLSLGLHAAKQSLTSFETVPSTLTSLPMTEDAYSLKI